MLRTLAIIYAAIMNHLFMSFGMLFVVQAVQAAKAFGSSPGSGEELETSSAASDYGEQGVNGLTQACRLLLGNFMMPFSEFAAAAIFPTDMASIKVLGFWVPTLLGGMIISTACLGHLSLKFRRSPFVLLYMCLVVVQLVWQVELNKILRIISNAEDLAEVVALSKQDRLQSVQWAMFEAPYQGFVEMYTEQKCQATLPNSFDAKVQFECAEESIEGNVMQFVVSEFCRVRKPFTAAQVQDFGTRVEACKLQGLEAKILPSRTRPREQVFCRCRSAIYDWLRFMVKWIMLLWCGELLGVCIVVYFCVEQNLEKMDPLQRREVLGFAIVGIAALVGRVTLLADYFDEGEVSMMPIEF